MFLSDPSLIKTLPPLITGHLCQTLPNHLEHLFGTKDGVFQNRCVPSDIWFDVQGWLICGSLLVVSVRLLVVCSRLVVVCGGLRSFVGGLWSLLRPRLMC